MSWWDAEFACAKLGGNLMNLKDLVTDEYGSNNEWREDYRPTGSGRNFTDLVRKLLMNIGEFRFWTINPVSSQSRYYCLTIPDMVGTLHPNFLVRISAVCHKN